MSLNHIPRPADPVLESTSVTEYTSELWLFLLFAAHLPLAVLMHSSTLLATIHGWGVFALGLWFLGHDKLPTRLIYLTGYVIGAGVLWRMTHAGVFWEFSKYATAFLFLLGLIKWHRHLRALPLVYGLLLIPSVIFTLSGRYSLTMLRSEISFNLSGPFLLMIAAIFFSGIELNKQQLQRLLLYTIMPITCIAFFAFFKIHEAKSIDFYQSNILTSGGFGPNQVSAILGMGALFCWLYILIQEKFSKMAWLATGFLLWFLVQAFLTFSRGGVYNFLIAGFFATPYLALKRRNWMKFLMFGAILVAIFFYILLKINAFTGHALEERFTDTETTGRWELIQEDLKLWQDNFLFGVGPGRSPALRGGKNRFSGIAKWGRGIPTHTEYTRMLAEHGIFGFLALLLLFIMFFQAFLKATNSYARGLTLAFMLWAMAEMSHAAMRLAAISYLFALPFAKFTEDK